jgi:hypothetical protein
MPKNTPLTVIRDFIRSLPEKTRDDAIVHFLMDYRGPSILGELHTVTDRAAQFEKYFSDSAVDPLQYRGVVLSLRAFIDHHIWWFTDEYNIDRQKDFMDALEKSPLSQDTVEVVRMSWNDRSKDLKAAASRWSELKRGPLSDIAIAEYSLGNLLPPARSRE